MTSSFDEDPAPFAALVERALTGALDRDPVEATYTGDHDRDGLLPDASAAAADTRARQLRATLAELDALPAGAGDQDAQIDAEVLRTVLSAELLALTDIDEARWNPMLHNPGAGLHSLLSRDFAPMSQRLASLTNRLTAVPAFLADARRRLGQMSRIHLDTALTQLTGTIAVIDREIPGDVPAAVADAARTARDAVVQHRSWLAENADAATYDPRLGEDLFRAKLALTLDTAFDPQTLLYRAQQHLERLEADILERAAQLEGTGSADRDTVRRVLDRLAADAPDDTTILPLCRDAFAECTRFVRDTDLVSVYDDPVEIVEMPEIDRGVAGAYCRPSGPLESAALPTEFAVSPTPADWPEDRVRSFYREYNAHMLHNLTVHEAMPGHALQLMHANRHHGATPVRAVWWSGTFVEGWAVYAEELMATRGYRDADNAALRMQQLKMQLRSTINTILDIRYHCDDLDEPAAMDLMQRRGYQEQGEAAGKWRRVQLSSTQLCTYFVGYTEVHETAEALRAARPDWTDRRVHDAMLAHGSPPPRHLRTLLGLT